VDFSKVDALKERLKNLRPLNAAEIKRLRDEFIINNTYNSNAIEGNTLTLRETALILEQGITIGEKPLKDHLEAIGHRDAFEFMYTLVDKNEPLTEWVIKQIHSLVLMNDRENKGVYRSVPVVITGAIHSPAQPYLIQPQMEIILQEYERNKTEKHIIQAIAEMHLNFEGTHPFIDGNGRTGRLIMNFELIKAGYLPINVKYADRRKYYDCFNSYFGEQHTNPLIDIITAYEEEELTTYIQKLTEVL
jgi:Fic family protein